MQVSAYRGVKHWLNEPREPLSLHVRELTSLTDEMLKDQQLPLEEVASTLGMCKYLFAHEAHEDAIRVEKALRPLPSRYKFPWCCTRLGLGRVHLEKQAHSLSFWAEHYKVDSGHSHRAVDDAHTLACILSLPSATRPWQTLLAEVSWPYRKRTVMQAVPPLVRLAVHQHIFASVPVP